MIPCNIKNSNSKHRCVNRNNSVPMDVPDENCWVISLRLTMLRLVVDTTKIPATVDKKDSPGVIVWRLANCETWTAETGLFQTLISPTSPASACTRGSSCSRLLRPCDGLQIHALQDIRRTLRPIMDVEDSRYMYIHRAYGMLAQFTCTAILSMTSWLQCLLHWLQLNGWCNVN